MINNASNLDMSGVIALSRLDYKKLTAMTKMPIGERDGDDSLFEIVCDGTLIKNEISDTYSEKNENENKRDVVTGILPIGGFIEQKTSEYCLSPNLPLHLHEASVIGGLSNTYIILLKKVYSVDRLRISIVTTHDYNNCNNNSNRNNNGDFNANEFDQWK